MGRGGSGSCLSSPTPPAAAPAPGPFPTSLSGHWPNSASPLALGCARATAYPHNPSRCPVNRKRFPEFILNVSSPSRLPQPGHMVVPGRSVCSTPGRGVCVHACSQFLALHHHASVPARSPPPSVCVYACAYAQIRTPRSPLISRRCVRQDPRALDSGRESQPTSPLHARSCSAVPRTESIQRHEPPTTWP